MMGYRVIHSPRDLPKFASKGEVIISLDGEPIPWVFNGSHWNRIYGYNESCEIYYVECPYCNTWVDVRDHCNCPNCTAPLHRNCLNKY